MDDDSLKIQEIEIEEIEVDIKIVIRRGKIIFSGIEGLPVEQFLEKIGKKILPEGYDKKALSTGTYTEKEIISLIKKYIESAILHIERANEIIEILSEE